MAEPKLPTKEDIQKLPRWAQVAFAARCARRVERVVLDLTLSQEKKSAVIRATDLAERAAADPASASSEADEKAAMQAAAGATHAANTCLDNKSANEAASASAMAAYAAAYAISANYAKAAEASSASLSTDRVADAARTAASAGHSRTAELIARDFASLLQHAIQQKWNDQTPVDPSVFGPMWPQGEPDWEKPAFADALPDASSPSFLPDSDLEFDLWIDPGEAKVDDIQELFRTLSDLNRVHGGAGLTFVSGKDKALVLKGA